MIPGSEKTSTRLKVLLILSGVVLFAFAAGQSVAILIDSETAQPSFEANGTQDGSWLNNSEGACADCLSTPTSDSEEVSGEETGPTETETTTNTPTETKTETPTATPTPTETETETPTETATPTPTETETATATATEDPTPTETTSNTTESSLWGGLLSFRIVAFGILFGLLLRKT